MPHNFKMGQTVRLAQGLTSRAPVKIEYKIIRQMPERGGEAQYRIKSDREPFERVVAESAIEKA